MATVYSLVCWGGRTGKNVTLSIASPCVGTLTNTANTGLRNGTKLVFSTSGALPTGITAGATYYAKPTGVSTFNLYTDEALTNIVNTSGSQSGTHTAKSVTMLDYFDQYGSRWGDAGSERCYDGIGSWSAARTAVAQIIDVEHCEIGEAFTEYSPANTGVVISMQAGSAHISTRVNGVYSEAFHFGQVCPPESPVGFILERLTPSMHVPTLSLTSDFAVVDGLRIMRRNPTNTYSTAGIQLAFGCTTINCVCTSESTYGNGQAIVSTGAGARIINGLSIGYNIGFSIPNYQAQCGFLNCLATNNNIGFYAPATNVTGVAYNCIALGNTTNWSVSSGFRGASNNIGGTGEAWIVGAGTQIEVTETSPFAAVFVDWANNDLRPASASSPQVDAGIEYYTSLGYDIAFDERPNYNNGGAEAFDVGCYEFDHGYGPRPSSTTVTFQGVNAGSEIRVYDDSANDLAGVESCTPDQDLTWNVTSGQQRIVIVHPDYRIKEFGYTNVAGSVTLPVQQEVDRWFSNPA